MMSSSEEDSDHLEEPERPDLPDQQRHPANPTDNEADAKSFPDPSEDSWGALAREREEESLMSEHSFNSISDKKSKSSSEAGTQGNQVETAEDDQNTTGGGAAAAASSNKPPDEEQEELLDEQKLSFGSSSHKQSSLFHDRGGGPQEHTASSGEISGGSGSGSSRLVSPPPPPPPPRKVDKIKVKHARTSSPSNSNVSTRKDDGLRKKAKSSSSIGDSQNAAMLQEPQANTRTSSSIEQEDFSTGGKITSSVDDQENTKMQAPKKSSSGTRTSAPPANPVPLQAPKVKVPLPPPVPAGAIISPVDEERGLENQYPAEDDHDVVDTVVQLAGENNKKTSDRGVVSLDNKTSFLLDQQTGTEEEEEEADNLMDVFNSNNSAAQNPTATEPFLGRPSELQEVDVQRAPLVTATEEKVQAKKKFSKSATAPVRPVRRAAGQEKEDQRETTRTSELKKPSAKRAKTTTAQQLQTTSRLLTRGEVGDEHRNTITLDQQDEVAFGQGKQEPSPKQVEQPPKLPRSRSSSTTERVARVVAKLLRKKNSSSSRRGKVTAKVAPGGGGEDVENDYDTGQQHSQGRSFDMQSSVQHQGKILSRSTSKASSASRTGAGVLSSSASSSTSRKYDVDHDASNQIAFSSSSSTASLTSLIHQEFLNVGRYDLDRSRTAAAGEIAKASPTSSPPKRKRSKFSRTVHMLKSVLRLTRSGSEKRTERAARHAASTVGAQVGLGTSLQALQGKNDEEGLSQELLRHEDAPHSTSFEAAYLEELSLVSGLMARKLAMRSRDYAPAVVRNNIKPMKQEPGKIAESAFTTLFQKQQQQQQQKLQHDDFPKEKLRKKSSSSVLEMLKEDLERLEDEEQNGLVLVAEEDPAGERGVQEEFLQQGFKDEMELEERPAVAIAQPPAVVPSLVTRLPSQQQMLLDSRANTGVPATSTPAPVEAGSRTILELGHLDYLPDAPLGDSKKGSERLLRPGLPPGRPTRRQQDSNTSAKENNKNSKRQERQRSAGRREEVLEEPPPGTGPGTNDVACKEPQFSARSLQSLPLNATGTEVIVLSKEEEAAAREDGRNAADHYGQIDPVDSQNVTLKNEPFVVPPAAGLLTGAGKATSSSMVGRRDSSSFTKEQQEQPPGAHARHPGTVQDSAQKNKDEDQKATPVTSSSFVAHEGEPQPRGDETMFHPPLPAVVTHVRVVSGTGDSGSTADEVADVQHEQVTERTSGRQQEYKTEPGMMMKAAPANVGVGVQQPARTTTAPPPAVHLAESASRAGVAAVAHDHPPLSQTSSQNPKQAPYSNYRAPSKAHSAVSFEDFHTRKNNFDEATGTSVPRNTTKPSGASSSAPVSKDKSRIAGTTFSSTSTSTSRAAAGAAAVGNYEVDTSASTSYFNAENTRIPTNRRYSANPESPEQQLQDAFAEADIRLVQEQRRLEQEELERQINAKNKIVKRWRSNKYAKALRELTNPNSRKGEILQTMRKDKKRRQAANKSLHAMLADIKQSYFYDEERELKDSQRFFHYVNYVLDEEHVSGHVAKVEKDSSGTSEDFHGRGGSMSSCVPSSTTSASAGATMFITGGGGGNEVAADLHAGEHETSAPRHETTTTSLAVASSMTRSTGGSSMTSCGESGAAPAKGGGGGTGNTRSSAVGSASTSKEEAGKMNNKGKTTAAVVENEHPEWIWKTFKGGKATGRKQDGREGVDESRAKPLYDSELLNNRILDHFCRVTYTTVLK
ncbi:unnamed protein product [Amoebophrya sp. A120]|nr:unnamed protein product [Amoebophrya sp. A120]|eukprot:GSA120T00014462001.1